jgi:hypothetical protein
MVNGGGGRDRAAMHGIGGYVTEFPPARMMDGWGLDYYGEGKKRTLLHISVLLCLGRLDTTLFTLAFFSSAGFRTNRWLGLLL